MRRLLISGACFAAGMALPPLAYAQTITDPVWSRPPSPELASDLLPGFANGIGVSGSALIECRLFDDGHPFRCRVVSESVPGLGFGAAARLVVASGELRTRRIDGQPTQGMVRTNVSFMTPTVSERGKTWAGRQPTLEGLRLARQVVDKMEDEELPTTESMMDGLDYDRRAVVRPWIEELITPSRERLREVRTVQLARLFSEQALHGMLVGKYPVAPNEEELLDACPEWTPKEAAAVAELRRRYCSRYQCEE